MYIIMIYGVKRIIYHDYKTMNSIKGWERGRGGETVLGPNFPLPILSNVAGSCPILVVHAFLPFSNICNYHQFFPFSCPTGD